MKEKTSLETQKSEEAHELMAEVRTRDRTITELEGAAVAAERREGDLLAEVKLKAEVRMNCVRIDLIFLGIFHLTAQINDTF